LVDSRKIAKKSEDSDYANVRPALQDAAGRPAPAETTSISAGWFSSRRCRRSLRVSGKARHRSDRSARARTQTPYMIPNAALTNCAGRVRYIASMPALPLSGSKMHSRTPRSIRQTSRIRQGRGQHLRHLARSGCKGRRCSAITGVSGSVKIRPFSSAN
jgi:hypothetical protein